MATYFPRSMNTHVTVFSPVFKVTKKHSSEKNHASYAPTKKSHYKKLCQKATVFPVDLRDDLQDIFGMGGRQNLSNWKL